MTSLHPGPQHRLPAFFRSHLESLSGVGLLLGTLFFAASLTPTLVPRTYLTQGADRVLPIRRAPQEEDQDGQAQDGDQRVGEARGACLGFRQFQISP